jgi:hypothetical protein
VVDLPDAALRLFGAPSDLAAPPGPLDTDHAAAAARKATAPAPALAAAAPDPYVLARLLEDGDREDLTWLCRQLSAGALAAWVERHGARRLSRRSQAFWAVTLDRPDLLPERRPELERRRALWPL